MNLLQKKFIDNDNVLLLSHSVTPEKDSFAVLAKYAVAKGVNYTKWELLMGSNDEIYNLGRKFYFAEEDLGEYRETSIFLYTENFILIDKSKMIRGIYKIKD